MFVSQPFYRQRKFWIRFSIYAPIVLFLIAFGADIWSIFSIFFKVLAVAIGLPSGGPPDLGALGNSFSTLIFTCCFSFLPVFAFWMVVVSHQALLPVRNWNEARRLAFRLLLYILRSHGPATFIRDGKQVATPEELNREGPGVALVKFNSAIVLEERVPSPSMMTPLWDFLDGPNPYMTRAAGPGIVFTRTRERVRGVVDLRKQFRMQPGVPAYTRDGIEIRANINCLFTIGQDPDVLLVAYVDEIAPENLQVLTIREIDDTQVSVSAFSDELDEADKNEIHRWVQATPLSYPYQTYEVKPVVTRTKGKRRQTSTSAPVYDPERVSAAVLSEARNAPDGTLVDWTELPLQVAIQTFREHLPRVNYDELYAIDQPGPFPMLDFKRRFRLAVRNQGILSFQFIRYIRGSTIHKGTYPRKDLIRYPVQPLRSSKVLRQRGIKIIAAGVGDLMPAPEVYKQRLDSWRARWDSEASTINARMELEAMRIRNHARAQAQREMLYQISEIFKQQKEYPTREALALRVLQALENAATEGATRQLVPGQTLEWMKTLRSWLSEGRAWNKSS